MPEHPARETDRAHDLRIARALRQSLDTLVRTEGGMTSDEVLAACTEFWVQVFVVAHIEEHRHYDAVPWDVVVERLEGLTEARRAAVTTQLRRAWGYD